MHNSKAVANMQITGQQPKLQILTGSFRGAALGLSVFLRGKNLLDKLPNLNVLPLPDFVFRERNTQFIESTIISTSTLDVILGLTVYT